jgi:hypothetical protein
MNKKEFFEWLETCPTHKWEVNDEFGDIGAGYIVVSFPTEEEDEEDGGVRAKIFARAAVRHGHCASELTTEEDESC